MSHVVSGCRIFHSGTEMVVTESPVQVKALIDVAKQGEMIEVHVRTGASAWVLPATITALAPMWRPVGA